MMFDGEVAWVTGSSTGIGRAVAMGLAEQGCRVVVHYNRSEDEAREVVEEISSSGGEATIATAASTYSSTTLAPSLNAAPSKR
jgi:NAD(P)-dependent dehydrogenase (short-subunit alcohol dehydrogenase family)